MKASAAFSRQSSASGGCLRALRQRLEAASNNAITASSALRPDLTPGAGRRAKCRRDGAAIMSTSGIESLHLRQKQNREASIARQYVIGGEKPAHHGGVCFNVSTLSEIA